MVDIIDNALFGSKTNPNSKFIKGIIDKWITSVERNLKKCYNIQMNFAEPSYFRTFPISFPNRQV